MIQFACTCGKMLQVPEGSAGKKARCPACQAVLQVPELPRTVQAEEPTGRPPTASERVQGVPEQLEEEERGGRRRRSGRYEDEEARERRRSRRYEDEEEREPRKPAPANSGKATASLILGIVSLLCGFTVLTGLPAVILGVLALKDIKKGLAGGRGVAMGGIVTGVLGMLLLPLIALPIALLLPAITKVKEASGRMQSANNLKQMALAMHNYHDVTARLPEQGTRAPLAGPQGKPLLSWRVALLPYVEQDLLYRRFRLDEPWDSPHNIQLLPLMPKIYQMPGQQPDGSGRTYYQVFAGPNTLFDGKRVALMDVMDGTANTLLIVEAGTAVPWTKPEDLTFDPDGPLPPLGNHFKGGFHVAFADGSVKMISSSTPPSTIKALVTRNGGEFVNLP